MRLCIPTNETTGLTATVCDHFGGAPCFTICDTDTQACETVSNRDLEHEHGACNPIQTIAGANADAVLCRGLGLRALERLNAGGITVLRTEAATVADALKDHAADKCQPIDPENTCAGHDCH